jgi:hypothetical protein
VVGEKVKKNLGRKLAELSRYPISCLQYIIKQTVRRCTILFPQLGPQYYDEKHQDILARMEAFYAQSITINQSFWGEADK